jgi:hypothetical protein
MRPTLLLVVLVLGLWVALARGARDRAVDAGTAIRLDIPEMVECAGLCLEARVRSSRVERVAERRIETVLTLDVARTFWGEDLAVRTVRLPGGLLEDHSGLIIPGMPTFAAGEEVLLFLSEEGSSGVRVPVGLSQGKLHVEVSLDGGRALTRNQGTTSTIEPRTGQVRCCGSGERFDYAEVIAQIHAATDSRRLGGKR